ncbi:MAG: alternative ribosome rescue aminoacyl-tRNA hydrolase ArfB [Pseudomonadota bacterium]
MSSIARHIASGICLYDDELQWHAVRASGPGGQHVNKTATAVALKFNIPGSRLPAPVKQRLLARNDRRIAASGVVVIRAQQARSQKQNKRAALDRLAALVAEASHEPKRRIATKTPARVHRARLAAKQRRSETKRRRAAVRGSDHD